MASQLKPLLQGEFEHWRVKRFYTRTNKGPSFAKQIGNAILQEQALETMASHVDRMTHNDKPPPKKRAKVHMVRRTKPNFVRRRIIVPSADPLLNVASADAHYHISTENRHKLPLKTLLTDVDGDPAYDLFLYNLKLHLLHRIRGPRPHPTREEIADVTIMDNLLFTHKVMRINFDTYDMHREQDSINPNSHPDIMMLAPEGSPHPFYYAHVIGIFHVYACTPNLWPEHWQQFHLCYVRWFEVDYDAIRPYRQIPLRWARLDENVFGFVDPANILRGCHLVPAFAYGRSDDALPGYSAARPPWDNNDCDWNRHKVAQFVDRDMFMRYFGGAPGHSHRGFWASARSHPRHQASLAEAFRDPDVAETHAMEAAARAASSEQAAEDEEDWYREGSSDEGEIDINDPNDLPGNDELEYAAAGFSLS